MEDWKQDLSDSQAAFTSYIWPLINDELGGGKLIPVESVTKESFANETLDCLAGVDAWQVVDKTGMRGIASRVQWCEDGKAWNTFTIRYSRSNGSETEFIKRRAAIASSEGWLYPSITIQAYMNGEQGKTGHVLSVCAAFTKDIIEIIGASVPGCSRREVNGGHADWYKQTVRSDGNTFAVVPWDVLTRKHLWHVIYDEAILLQNAPF